MISPISAYGSPAQMHQVQQTNRALQATQTKKVNETQGKEKNEPAAEEARETASQNSTEALSNLGRQETNPTTTTARPSASTLRAAIQAYQSK